MSVASDALSTTRNSPSDSCLDSAKSHSASNELEEQIKQLKVNYVQTGLFYFVFIAMGSISSIVGPTLLDLAKIIRVHVDDIGIIFTFKSIGNVTGSLLGGVILDKFSKKIAILIFFSLGMTFFMLAIPFSPNLIVMETLCFCAGFSSGGLNNGVNVCLLNIWKEKASAFFLALHFSFGIGAFLGPLIASPFLGDEKPNVKADILSGDTESTAILWAYVIVCGLAFLATISLATFNIFVAKGINKTTTDTFSTDEDGPVPPIHYKILALAVSAVAIFSTSSVESTYCSMISPYAVEGNLALSKQKASYLTSAYWGAYMVTRFVSIFVASRVTDKCFVVFDVVAIITGSIILVSWGIADEVGLWIGSIVLGMGIATLFPSSITWLKNHMAVTYKIGSMFFIMGSAAGITWPPILTRYLKTMPNFLYYHVLLFSVACAVFYSLLHLIFLRMSRNAVSEDSRTKDIIIHLENSETSVCRLNNE